MTKGGGTHRPTEEPVEGTPREVVRGPGRGYGGAGVLVGRIRAPRCCRCRRALSPPGERSRGNPPPRVGSGGTRRGCTCSG